MKMSERKFCPLLKDFCIEERCILWANRMQMCILEAMVDRLDRAIYNLEKDEVKK